MKMTNYTSNNETDIFLKTLQNDLYLYILPVVVVTGGIGNLATLLVFSNPKGKFSKMSIGVYLLSYSILNLLNLFFIFGESWIVDAFHVHSIENLSDWTCKIWNFVNRVMNYSCVWIIVCLTIDRYIYVCHNINAKRLCTVFLAKVAVVFVIVGLGVTSVHAMWSFHIIDGRCKLIPDRHVPIWQWITMCIFCFIPVSLLFFLNLRILIGLCRKRREMLKSQQSYTFTMATQAISVTYLLLITPATVANIKEYFDRPSHVTLLRTVSDFLTCGNPTVFFFMCLLFSRTFRSELLNFLRKKPISGKTISLDTSKLNKYEYIECASETFV